jgi:hypothetical protein
LSFDQPFLIDYFTPRLMFSFKKKIFAIVAIMSFYSAAAQNKLEYRVILKNNSNKIITRSSVNIRVSIFRNSIKSKAVYVEDHKAKTDSNGVVDLLIGTGKVLSGSFSKIQWSSHKYFIKSESDIEGNGNYTNSTIVQVSGNYLEKVNNVPFYNGSESGCFKHFIGEQFGGGVVFHLWKDQSGEEHGLIVDLKDLSNSQAWSNVTQNLIGTSAQSSWNGYSNSKAIVAQEGHSNSAAALCMNSKSGGFNDWYLPSIQELTMLWNNYFNVAKSLSQIKGANELASDYYWSSSEGNDDAAWFFYFNPGFADFDGKFYTTNVRAIRAF